MSLTIVCVTENRPHARPFVESMATCADGLGARFALAVDGDPEDWMFDLADVWRVNSKGYLESVLDEVIGSCLDGYILRLDDDERIGPEMFCWLSEQRYLEADHWAFPRMNLFPDADHFIENPPLYPDLQTRLSVKRLAGGRDRIHAGSPNGTGMVAPVAIEHHKFLVRSREEREMLVERYEQLQPGAGYQYVMFSLPENYREVLSIKPLDRRVVT